MEKTPTQIIFEFLNSEFFFTWPLSRRGVWLNRLAAANGSVRLLLRQQHALIHRPCEVVHVAAAEHTHTPRREFRKVGQRGDILNTSYQPKN